MCDSCFCFKRLTPFHGPLNVLAVLGAHLGVILGPSWTILGELGALLVIFGSSWPSWGHLGPSLGYLGAIWGQLGAMGTIVGAIWGLIWSKRRPM